MEEKKDTSYLFRPVIKPAEISLDMFPIDPLHEEEMRKKRDEKLRQNELSKLKFSLNSYLRD